MQEEKETKKTSHDEVEEKALQQKGKQQVSETWAQDVIEDMDDFIESQGIYLRQ